MLMTVHLIKEPCYLVRMNHKQVVCDFEQMQTDQCYNFPFSFEFHEKCLDQVPIPYLNLGFPRVVAFEGLRRKRRDQKKKKQKKTGPKFDRPGKAFILHGIK